MLLSSVAVYGAQSVGGVVDEECPPLPLGAYAESKYEAERQAAAEAAAGNMSLSILRLATAYGEGDPGNVAHLIRAIDRRHFVPVGPLGNWKILIHRNDAARACALPAHKLGGPAGTFNVAAKPCRLKKIVETIASELGTSLPRTVAAAAPVKVLRRAINLLTRGEGRLGMIQHILDCWFSDDVYDGTKFTQTFDVYPAVELRGGLHREVAWYRGVVR